MSGFKGFFLGPGCGPKGLGLKCGILRLQRYGCGVWGSGWTVLGLGLGVGC